MRLVQSQPSAADISDIRAWLDSLAPRAIADTRDLNGSWYDPASSGRGFNFSVLPDDAFARLFQGHRDDGSDLILAGNAVHRPRHANSVSDQRVGFEGGRYDGFDPSLIRLPPWGRLDLCLVSCTRAEASLDGRDGRQTLLLQPLDADRGAGLRRMLHRA